MSTELILTNLPTETLAEMAAEKAALVEQHGRKTVQAAIDCGRYLTEIKGRLGHGEWLPWLEAHWQYSVMRANQFVRMANLNHGLNLEEANSIREALRMIGEAEEAAGTKRTRKPAEPSPEVIDNRPVPSPAVRAHTATNATDEADDDEEKHTLPPAAARAHDATEPPPLPKTNTHHTPATQQRIDRGPDPAPPQAIEDAYGMPLLEVVISNHTTQEVVDALIVGLQGPQAEKVATILRKAADKLDPPAETKAPTLPQMRAIIDERAKLPPADDRHLKPPVAAAASEWAAHKSSMIKSKRYQSRTSWEACLTRMATMTLERGADVVCDMIQRAIASGYQGWEFEATAPRNTRPAMRNTNIRTGRNFDAEMGPAIHLSDVEEFQ